MSSSRARSRFAALFAAVPVLVATGPVFAPAVASADVAPVRVADLALVDGKPRIGPRAGFRGATQYGVNGTTAIFAVDAAPSATLSKVTLHVDEASNFSVFDDFDQSDGFALYKDLNDDDQLDPADYAAGPVSQATYGVTGNGHQVIVTITASGATGEDSYLITVHPSTRQAADRVATFTVPVGGVVASTGNLPTAAVTRDNVVIDSAPPVAIPLTSFVPVNRAPSGSTCPANADCGNDGYQVSVGDKAVETDEQLGFFNNGSDLSDGALLVVPNAGEGTHAAIYPVAGLPTASATELSIGNGTGRDPSVSGSRALNNQVNDDVWATQWDVLGNSVGQLLTNAAPAGCASPCAGTPQRGNDVTSPAVGYSLSVNNVTATSTGGQTAAPVTGTVTGADSTIPAGRPQTPVAQLAMPEQVVGTGNPVTYTVAKFGDEHRSASTVTPSSSAQQIVTTVDVESETKFPNSSLWRASGRLVDTLGNATPSKKSNVAVKDVVAPKFLAISLIDGNGDGNADEGETYRVTFDDPIDTSKVTSGNVNTTLTVKDPDETCNDVTVLCKNWGRNPTVTWSADGRILSIKLGEHCTSLSATCNDLNDLPEPGDKVTAAASVTDPVGNKVSNSDFPIGQPIVLPMDASTIDTTAPTGNSEQGTGRDGILDAIDVRFTSTLKPTSATASADKFTVTLNGETLTATAALLAGNNTMRVSFTVPAASRPLWGTGATPVVKYAGTSLLSSNDQVIAAFELTSIDRVAPLPAYASTQDLNGDGRIDHVLVKYSEAIVHGAENPCGYTVQGYSSTTYSPAGATTVPSAATCPKRGDEVTMTGRNKPSPVPPGATVSDTVSLELKVGSAFDTVAMPAVEFRANNPVPAYGANTPPACNPTGNAASGGSPNCPVVDANGNGLASFSTTAADAAGPAIVERTTADSNSDGRLDYIAVKYSEAVSSASVGNALFTVSEPAYTITSIAQVSSTDLRIFLENVAPRQGDTGVTPKLTGLGGTTDTRDPGNPTPADTGVLVTDKAGPALRSGCASSPAGNNGTCPVDSATDDKIAVFFSEAVDAASVLPADFVVEQPAGTPKTGPTAHAMAADGKSVVLTFAEGTFNPAEDAFVHLAAAGSILDASPAKNPNTQTTNVTVFKTPTATLSLSCATAANPGYCGSLTVNTGIVASSAVSLWRLSETARSATPADSEFSATPPSTYTFLTEGAHTLYLTGKDDFGRMTTEDSDDIKVVLAPTIKNVQMVISTPRASNAFSTFATVVDGDNVSFGADAVGSDAAEWATAATGGGCKQANMSIDLRGLTKVSTQDAVAPFKCDLKTTTTPPYRQMQFPVVKATGTTRYPVGTVLRTSTNPADPGAMIVDGPGGTQLRRHFISAGARRSHMISDAQVIRVPTAVLEGVQKTSGIGYRDGAVVKTTGTGYYYMYGNIKRPVSTATLAAWKIPTSHAYNLSSAEFKAMGTGVGIASGGPHATGTWIKLSNGSIQQIVRNGQGVVVRRAVGSTAALPTLVPGTQIYPANTKDQAIPFDTFLRGYRDGTLLKLSGGRYGVVARASLRVFAEESPGTSRTFNTLGYNTTNARAANGAAMPRVQGLTYRTGEPVNRYRLSPDVVISVRNTAGTLVTATLRDANGLYGVGTLDPAPEGWDFTR
jgi:hypothetical protein